MPYIDPMDRVTLKAPIDYVLLTLNEKGYNPGWINYIITKIIFAWWKASAQNYATIASICGVLDNVKTEFYFRVAVPYERAKQLKNGDVYE
jgi:hypothetical protein